ncbi:MAG TPA: glutathione S-transferase family protein [Candidatus Eisenbacteria bacterium]|nr:glutathione S-transferase family protein [Candidatus Eisenbacteria bacterium]
MEIALYYAPNTCAIAPYITLTEAGANFEVRPLNYRKRQNFSPEYLKINPKHKVPTLVVDGKILTENVAIHQWVHRTFPAAKILPADPWAELQAIALHAWCASGIHPYLSRINNPAKVCDVPGGPESVVKIATEALFENFRIADDMLAGREYFFNHFTAPDAHFFWCCRRATQLGVELSGFPNVLAHFRRMQERASVKKLLSYEEEVNERFAKSA